MNGDGEIPIPQIINCISTKHCDMITFIHTNTIQYTPFIECNIAFERLMSFCKIWNGVVKYLYTSVYNKIFVMENVMSIKSIIYSYFTSKLNHYRQTANISALSISHNLSRFCIYHRIDLGDHKLM